MTTAGTPQPNWDTPAELGQPAAKLGQPGRVGRPMQGWDDPVKWDSLPQGGMARSWDTPAKLGQPSQTGTTQPNWDSPAAWDVQHRVGRPNRLGCPMQMWDDSSGGSSHNLPGTHHPSWDVPHKLGRSNFSPVAKVGGGTRKEEAVAEPEGLVLRDHSGTVQGRGSRVVVPGRCWRRSKQQLFVYLSTRINKEPKAATDHW